MSDLPQGRRPTKRLTRPLLLAGAGLAVIKITAGCFTSGNLVAPPCDAGDDCYGEEFEDDAGQVADGGTSDGGTDAGP